MVSYQEFVSVVFDVANARGDPVNTLERSQSILTTAGRMWSENREELRSMTQAEAQSWVRQNTSV